MKHLILISIFLCTSCASIPNKPVILSGEDSAVFEGSLKYDGPYTGTLFIPSGPNNESFTGRFIVVDKTSTKKSSGNVVVPNGGVIPALGSTNSSESGEINATGYWVGIGNKNSSLKCELAVGMGGHGKGVCTHSNGLKFEITL